MKIKEKASRLNLFRRDIAVRHPGLSELIDQSGYRLAYATKARTLQRVKNLIMRHMRRGDSWEEFAEEVAATIRNEPDRLFAPHYLRMVYQGMAVSAYGLAVWQSGMTRAALNLYPAWKFVRIPGSRIYRPRHHKHENDIRLKTDWAYWADYQNGADIGGFEKPYPQFGYNSHMIQEPVTFEMAARHGLIDRSRKGRLRLTKRMRFYPDFPANYREGSTISVHGLDTKTKEELKKWLRSAGCPARIRRRTSKK